MKIATFDPNFQLMQIGRQSRVLQVVYKGNIEVYLNVQKKNFKGKIPNNKYFDMNKFPTHVELVIDTISKGSLICPRAYIRQHKCEFTAQCRTPVTLFYISYDQLNEIKDGCEVMSEEVSKVYDARLSENKRVSLDYINGEKSKNFQLKN